MKITTLAAAAGCTMALSACKTYAPDRQIHELTVYCGSDAVKQCEAWLSRTRHDLGERVVSISCATVDEKPSCKPAVPGSLNADPL